MSSAFIVLKKKKGNEGGGGSDEQNKMEGLPCKCRHWLPLHFGGRSESLCSHCNPFVTESGLCQVCVPFHLVAPKLEFQSICLIGEERLKGQLERFNVVNVYGVQ